jgi:homoserine dehydrogenase
VKINTVILGFGNVGRGFASVLLRKAEYLHKRLDIQLIVLGVVEIGPDGSFHSAFSEHGLDLMKLLETRRKTGTISAYSGAGGHYSSLELIERSGAQLMLEMTPTNLKEGEPGLSHIGAALARGMSVVTSNKGPLLFGFKDLKRLAEDNNVGFGYSAAVAGALPIIPTGCYALAGCQVDSIEGILNGTSNYILTEMTNSGVAMQQALVKAQQMEIAETDPRLDIEGYDTAFKLLISANSIMDADAKISDVKVSGIEHVTQDAIEQTRSRGCMLKLIGRARRTDDHVDMSVGLEEIHPEHPFYSVNGIWKAVKFETDLLGGIVLLGGKSDPELAAGAMLRDIVNLARESRIEGGGRLDKRF